MKDKATIVSALSAFIRQRPGLEFGNYGSLSAYRAEMRGITRAFGDANAMLRFIAGRDSITAEAIVDGIGGAFAGRLRWTGKEWDYCAGQYWPTEYRRAACVGMADVLWHWFRAECKCDTREKIQSAARRELGPAIAKRWFR